MTHHPLIFKGIKQITTEDFIGRRLIRLIQNDIAYYAMHTNFDVKGMADLSAAMIGLLDTEVLDVTVYGNGREEGIGRIGSLMEPMALEIGNAILKGAEVLITGDIDYHDGIDAAARGLCIIDAGHYGLEHIFIPYMKEYLKDRLANVEIISQDIASPYRIL